MAVQTWQAFVVILILWISQKVKKMNSWKSNSINSFSFSKNWITCSGRQLINTAQHGYFLLWRYANWRENTDVKAWFNGEVHSWTPVDLIVIFKAKVITANSVLGKSIKVRGSSEAVNRFPLAEPQLPHDCKALQSKPVEIINITSSGSGEHKATKRTVFPFT